jgi:tRNA A37 threonylcarbamoyladenosine biosynthesis protein TsaE
MSKNDCRSVDGKARRFKHEISHRTNVTAAIGLPEFAMINGKMVKRRNVIHTFVYRWNDCDNEGMLEVVERLALSGFISVNSELFSYVASVAKGWKLS